MGQVIRNLLSNAVKYSPDGGVIRLRVATNQNNLIFSVEDEGMGMTMEQVDRVYDKFYRANSAGRSIPGTGLGMSIVKNIVEGHGGKVWIRSKPAKGTTVYFSISRQEGLEATFRS